MISIHCAHRMSTCYTLRRCHPDQASCLNAHVLRRCTTKIHRIFTRQPNCPAGTIGTFNSSRVREVMGDTISGAMTKCVFRACATGYAAHIFRGERDSCARSRVFDRPSSPLAKLVTGSKTRNRTPPTTVSIILSHLQYLGAHVVILNHVSAEPR